jgi:hypothetical protein
MPVPFDVIYHSQIRKDPTLRRDGILMALDPGQTTGVAVFEDGKLKDQLQIKTWPMVDCVQSFRHIFDVHKPKCVVFESYQVYEWKTEDHTWSQIPTVQVIGCIQTLLILQNIPYFTQTAQVAKQFVSDEKLEEWGYWFKGIRHARDAIRHGLYFLLFGPSKPKK